MMDENFEKNDKDTVEAGQTNKYSWLSRRSGEGGNHSTDGFLKS
jgi:hypothetical protein